jgi:hypothetical protein
MKRETLRHPKTYDLAARLDVDRPTALGYLTLTWDFVAEVTPSGDIGRWPNGAIARACDYLGDPDKFVNALVDAGWLDQDDEYRLVVHDWPDHCERWVRSKMTSLGLSFCACYGAKSPSRKPSADALGDVSPDASSDPPRDRTEPNQTKPINTGRPEGRPEESGDTTADAAAPLVIDDTVWNSSLALMQAIRSTLQQPDVALKTKDRELTIKAAILAKHRFGDAWLNAVLQDFRDRSAPPDRPWGWFKGALAKSAKRAGHDFYAVEEKLVIPRKYLEARAAGAAAKGTAA